MRRRRRRRRRRWAHAPAIYAASHFDMKKELHGFQPRPQGFLLDDGGSSGDSPGKGGVTWYKISKNLGDFYHVTFLRKPKQKGGKALRKKQNSGQNTYLRTCKLMHEAVMAS